ncbi:MAG: tellurite resistance TerB family protein [Hoeflea sp.]|uniref:tellurite resistance TerB family protein n=1 Tax=Hoeflea sp. TaxID=1940281 RepID=UPI0032EAAEB7
MFDPKTLLDQFLGSNVPGTQGTVRDKAGQASQLAKNNPLATGAIVAVLLGTKTGRSLGGSALKLGGMAAIAGLGYQAWKNYQAGKAPADSATGEPDLLAPPSDSEFSAEPAAVDSNFALSLVRVMIAAARADGHVDDAERARIHDKLALSGLADDAVAFLDRALAEPVDMDSLIASAKTEAQKVEMFTAARLAIDPDTRAERGFLDLLAGRLGLADPLVDHIDATVAAAKG